MSLHFKELFSFNSTERNGIILLLSLIILLSIVPVTVEKFLPVRESPADSLFLEEVKEFEAGISRIRSAGRKGNFASGDLSIPGGKVAARLFMFDPNTLSEKGWRELGLNDGQIRSIMNYIQKGGSFRERKDLQKMYCLSSGDYQRLEPYITIQPTNKIAEKGFPGPKAVKTEKEPVDLNLADSVILLSIRGIGPAFAHRIIRYRELLGGFYAVNQLREVYGFDEERYNLVSSFFRIYGEPFRKIDVNKLNYNDMRRHPYMGPALAKAIIDRRIIRGQIRSLDELKSLAEMSEQQFQKLQHYISLE